MGIVIKKYKGRTLSKFASYHEADVCEIYSAKDAIEAFRFAEKENRQIFVLGGGSNVFFKRTKVRTLILKNCIEPKLEQLTNKPSRFEVSANLQLAVFLRRAYELSLDCSYYLASAPCEIGGAIAMNAGTGIRENLAISDFLESVTFADANGIHTLKKDEINFSFRHSQFLDTKCMILSAVFALPPRKFAENPILARMAWAKENQDLSTPNCGSLCDKYNANILKFARFCFKHFGAGLSPKKLNWARNTLKNPTTLRACLALITILHKLLAKDLIYEIRIID